MSMPTNGPAGPAAQPVATTVPAPAAPTAPAAPDAPAAPAAGYDATELALGAVAAHVEHGSGLLSSAELTAALATTVSGLQTQADAFELVDRLAQVAARSLTLAARALGTEPTHLLTAASAGAAGTERAGAPRPRYLR